MTTGHLLFMVLVMAAALPVLCQTAPVAQEQTTALEPPTPPAAKPDTPSPLTPEKRADVFMARKMYREAIEAYEQEPVRTAILWNKIGIAYHQMMQLGTAKRCYEKSLKLNPKYPEARNNLGAVFYAQRSYRRAIKEYNRALKLNPNSASIYSNLGTAYFARKKYKDAFKAYQQALAIDPEVFEHRSTHGVLLQERTVAERARFHYFLAKTYAQAGMNERALEYIRKSLEEGFKDRKKFIEEPEFAALQALPEFQELMTKDFRVL